MELSLKRGFRSTASLILVRNVVGELQPKRTLAASRGFLAAARLSCSMIRPSDRRTDRRAIAYTRYSIMLSRIINTLSFLKATVIAYDRR